MQMMLYTYSFQRDVKLGILTTNCLHVQRSCNGAYSSQYVSHRLWVVVCVLLLCPHIFFKFVHQTSFTLFMSLRWNLINLLHDEFTVMYSNEPKLCGSSIGWSPDLTAVVVVSITAMGKWLLVCLQMVISAGSTQVCHGIASVDLLM